MFSHNADCTFNGSISHTITVIICSLYAHNTAYCTIILELYYFTDESKEITSISQNGDESIKRTKEGKRIKRTKDERTKRRKSDKKNKPKMLI